MSEAFNWDQFRSGEFISFKEVGDNVVGTLIAVRIGKDFNGEPCPELMIRTDDGEERKLTAGQVMLKAELAVAQPAVGDRVAITYSGVGEAKPGKAPAKLFDVAVKKPEKTAPSGAADLL